MGRFSSRAGCRVDAFLAMVDHVEGKLDFLDGGSRKGRHCCCTV